MKKTEGNKKPITNPRYHFNNNFTTEPKKYNDLLLYQIGEMMCDLDMDIINHIHLDWYEFTYIISGKGEIATNNIKTKVQEGEIYFSHPREVHRIHSDVTDPLRYFFCAFNFEDNSPLKKLIESTREKTTSEKNRLYHSKSIFSYFQHLLIYIKNNSPLDDMAIEFEMKAAVIKFIMMVNSEKIEEYTSPKINNKRLLCFNIINYIDANIYNIGDVMSISEIFHYNHSYLSKCFKTVIGESISSYISNKKLSVAKQMLESENMTVTETAEALHYSSIYVFSRSFKQKYHISPSEFQKRKK